VDSLASLDGLTEDIGVLPVVIPELKLGDVQMQILFADLVESPDDPALQDRPEAFNGLSVDCAVNVLVRPMVKYWCG
jgi:hypothetical protein